MSDAKTEPIEVHTDSGTSSSDQGSKDMTWFENLVDGFRPIDYTHDVDPNMSDVEKANYISAKSPLKRELKSRHMQMIAIGGSIGTGLFVGSGSNLSTGGPAGLLIGFGLTGLMMYCTVQALGELAIAFPVSGGFNIYNTRFISAPLGFTLTWNYTIGWLVILPYEVVAATIVIQYWDTTTNPAAWVSPIYFFILFINFFGVRGYGETEFILSGIKVITIVGFIILGIVLNCGGGPEGEYLGGLYWQDPGAFANGAKGVFTVFVTAAFSFSGTELVGLAAAETDDPRKTLPRATKQVFWRITLFYMISLTLVGLLVPYTEPRLLGASSYSAASPFVIAIQNGGIKGLPSVFNAVILVAVMSVANTGMYATSRCFLSLAEQGFGPKWFGYVDKRGRPLVGIAMTLIFGLLSYLSCYWDHATVFTWMLSLSGLSALFTFGAIMLCHIRFRAALKAHGRDTSELSFTAQTGLWGSYFGVTLIVVILGSQFWVALWPIGEPPSAEAFFEVWLCLPLCMATYIFWCVWKRDYRPFRRAIDIDIDTGRREVDLDLLKQEIAEEKALLATKPFYFRIYRFWC